jgi:hypothetical protein
MGRRHMQSVDEGPLPLPVPLVAQSMEQRATDASSPYEPTEKKMHKAIRRLPSPGRPEARGGTLDCRGPAILGGETGRTGSAHF